MLGRGRTLFPGKMEQSHTRFHLLRMTYNSNLGTDYKKLENLKFSILFSNHGWPTKAKPFVKGRAAVLLL